MYQHASPSLVFVFCFSPRPLAIFCAFYVSYLALSVVGVQFAYVGYTPQLRGAGAVECVRVLFGDNGQWVCKRPYANPDALGR